VPRIRQVSYRGGSSGLLGGLSAGARYMLSKGVCGRRVDDRRVACGCLQAPQGIHHPEVHGASCGHRSRPGLHA
jgi:hypothetical protein